MNIALISLEYPPETGFGGIGSYTHTLAHALSGRGHVVHVISATLGDHDQCSMDGAVHVHRLASQTPSLLKRFNRGLGIWQTFERARHVDRYISRLHREVCFDVVEAQDWGGEALWYCLHPCAPLVVRCVTPLATHMKLSGRPPIGMYLRRWLERMPPRRATTLMAASAFIAGIAEANYGIPRRRFHIVPLAVDTEQIHAASHCGETYSTSSWRGKTPTVLFVGRLEVRKGARHLLEAIPAVVAAVPEVQFRIVGHHKDSYLGFATYQDYFNSFATDTVRQATTFLGFVDQDQLEQEYAACDIFVAPSLFESFGLVHLEAMAHGKPVIACCSGATPEVVIDGETGVLVPPEDSHALAAALMRLLRAPAEAQRMGAQARQRALDVFSLHRMVDRTLAVYQQAAGKQARS